MRGYAEVYSAAGTKLAFIDALVSCGADDRLDEAGTFSLQCGLDESVITYLVTGNQVYLYVQEDEETPQLWARGRIIKTRIQENGSSLNITISGRDQIDELRDRVVGLGRSYDAQTVQTILSDLVELVPDWTVTVETASASQLQTARYDGAKVLRAVVRTVEELGLHFRKGTAARTLEVGAFGTEATTSDGRSIRAVQAPSSISRELYDRDDLLLIEDISVTEDNDNPINWAIPLGAGEGSAATTLKDTTYEILNTDNTVYRAGTTPDYPIYISTNDFNIDEYSVDASDGGTLRQETLSFKQIAPIANSLLAKQNASDALAKATFESLRRSRETLVTYDLTVRKMRVNVKPGDLLPVQYKGIARMTGNPRATQPDLTYINVDEDLWVMGVRRTFSDSGIVTTLQVATIDRHMQDETDILVELRENMDVKNVSVQTFPFGFQDSSERVIQGNAPATTPYKDATFSLQIPDIFTDVSSVTLHFITRPLYSMTDVGPVISAPSALQYYYGVYEGTNYPSDISLYIDGVDRTSALGGPWNPSAGNSPVDEELDITTYITEAAGGLYQDHSIVFKAGDKTGEGRVNTAHTSSTNPISHGIIEAKILFLGNARAIL